MFNRFTRDARLVVEQAEREARAAGSRSIEAEHLLLGLTARGRAAQVLADAGLDHAAVADALATEERASLEAVGVDAGEFGALAPRPAPRHLRFGASSKLALERTVKEAVGARRLESTHVLCGVLAAERGRVPRALELAGVDREALRAALR